MAFDTSLVAISLAFGQYRIVSQLPSASIDVDAMQKDNLWRRIASDSAEAGDAAVVGRADFSKYLLPLSQQWGAAAAAWYSNLPQEVEFVLVHRFEWDS